MHELKPILHHYPQSPVAEKVRKVLGIKQLAWLSVQIPRVPPKPDLMPLTGGYRRTPVMQIGADIYCDSHRIITELEARYPAPTLFPDCAASSWLFARWTDSALFTQCISLVLGSAADSMPADFAADRLRLYFGDNADLSDLSSSITHVLGQLGVQFGHLNDMLGDAEFFDGHTPGLKDVLVYYLLWFVTGRYTGGSAFLERFALLPDWFERMQSIDQGDSCDITSDEALVIARNHEPMKVEGRAAGVEEPFEAGMQVNVVPDGDGGDPPVTGTLIVFNHHEIAIQRHSEELGNTMVHFPRLGYRCE